MIRTIMSLAQPKKILKFFSISLLCILLTACGFHLQGYYNFDPQVTRIYVKTPRQTNPFIVALKEQLIANKIKIVPTAKAATAILEIPQISQSVALSSLVGNGQTGIYTVTNQLTFWLLTQSHQLLIAPTVLNQSQNITSTSSRILARSYRVQQISTTMNQTLATDLISMLARVKPNQIFPVNYQAYEASLPIGS